MQSAETTSPKKTPVQGAANAPYVQPKFDLKATDPAFAPGLKAHLPNCGKCKVAFPSLGSVGIIAAIAVADGHKLYYLFDEEHQPTFPPNWPGPTSNLCEVVELLSCHRTGVRIDSASNFWAFSVDGALADRLLLLPTAEGELTNAFNAACVTMHEIQKALEYLRGYNPVTHPKPISGSTARKVKVSKAGGATAT